MDTYRTAPVPPRARARKAEAGQATAELALGLPTVGAVLVLVCWLLAAAGAQARLSEAARIGARAAARGDADTRVTAWVLRAVPDGAAVTIIRLDDEIAVTVRYRLDPAGPLGSVDLSATAIAPAEPPAPPAVSIPADPPTSAEPRAPAEPSTPARPSTSAGPDTAKPATPTGPVPPTKQSAATGAAAAAPSPRAAASVGTSAGAPAGAPAGTSRGAAAGASPAGPTLAGNR